MKEKILDLLKNSNNFVSGQGISEKLGISRAAVWKHIVKLKSEGYEIESIPKLGYRLVCSPNLLNYNEIQRYLKTDYIGRNLYYFDSVDSTNIKAKELASDGEKEGTIVISEEQTKGKGRIGRSFISPKYKGIWMSIILRPNVEAVDVTKIVHIGAAAVWMALQEMQVECSIKWPNDIVLNHKKLCGILTEMNGELNKVSYVIMGIGINVNIEKDEFPEELRSKATSLKVELGKVFDRKKLTAAVLNHFEKLYSEFKENVTIKHSIEICRKNSELLGKNIKIISRNDIRIGKAVDLNDNGELLVKFEDGTLEKIVSGEISTRGLYGYV